MTARTVELSADQLMAIGAQAHAWELCALVGDPDTVTRPAHTGCGFPATAERPALFLTWRGRDGITGTVHDRDVRVTDAELVAWARALPGGYGGVQDREQQQRAVKLFTQTRCAAPVDFVPPPMSGPQSARTLHVCAVPAIYRDETVRELITHAGVPEYGFDFPYPCRWCQRVGYHESMADRPEVDALAERLRKLGVLVSDDRTAPTEPEYVGQGMLW